MRGRTNAIASRAPEHGAPTLAGMLAVAVLALGCVRTSMQRPIAKPPAARANIEDIRPRTRELMHVTVPLLSGEALPLASLRGQPILLALLRDDCTACWDLYKLVRALAHDPSHRLVAIVLVSIDGERTRLLEQWERDGGSARLAWDPQGALAARLQVVTLPAVFVVDVEGTIAHVQMGFGDGDKPALERKLRSVLP